MFSVINHVFVNMNSEKKRSKAQNVRFRCKIKPLTFYYSKKRKIRLMVLLLYTRCSSTFFFDHQQNRRKTFYWTVGYEWRKRNLWTERSVLWQSGNFYQRQHQPFFSLIRGNIDFFSLLIRNIIHFMLTKQFKQT